MDQKRSSTPEAVTLPRPPLPTIAPAAFVLFTQPGCRLTPQQILVYLQAFEEAQRVVQPSILERDLLGVWN